MTMEIIVGLVVIALSLGTVIFLTLWSRRIIERIHLKSSKILPEIKREIDDE